MASKPCTVVDYEPEPDVKANTSSETASIELVERVSESAVSVLFRAQTGDNKLVLVRRFKAAADSKSSTLTQLHRAAAAQILRSNSELVHLLRPLREIQLSQSAEFDEPSIVFEHCNHGTLSAFVMERAKAPRHFTDQELLNLAQQLASGLSSLHSAGLAHCELAMRNILVEADASKQCVLKIDDFRAWPEHELKVRLRFHFA